MLDSKSRQKVKKINTIELINSDPLLSEFKYHFILHKVKMPRTLTLEQFAETIHEGFKLPSLNASSVYIIQLINVSDNDLVDLAVGFRRDADAMKIYREVSTFDHMGHESRIQLSNGFGIFMEELQNEEKMDDMDEGISLRKGKTQYEQESGGMMRKSQSEINHLDIEKMINEDDEIPRNKEADTRFLLQDFNFFKKDKTEKVDKADKMEKVDKVEKVDKTQKMEKEHSSERSSSRSRQKHPRKKDMRERLTKVSHYQAKKPQPQIVTKIALLLVPQEVKRGDILDILEKRFCQLQEITYFQWRNNPLPYIEVIFNQSFFADKLLNAHLKINGNPILLLTEIQSIERELLARQIKYQSNLKKKKMMSDLYTDLKKEKTENNKVIQILECSNYFIVTFQNPVIEFNDYFLQGWNYTRNEKIGPFSEKPSLSKEWYSLLDKKE